MKIRKILLRNYGPIDSFHLEPGNFNVIFGANESGKTALVEALTYVLFKNFSVRYGKPTDITVEVDLKGKTVIFPAAKVPALLPRQEIASLLYIAASDSMIYKGGNDQARFWDSLKLMLSRVGSQIPFARLIAKIREDIGYQPKREEWKSEKKQLIDGDQNRNERLRMFLKEIGEIESKKKEMKKLSEEHAKLSEELKIIEACRKYQTYKEIKDLHNNYIDKKNNLSFFSRYEDEDYEQWHDLEMKKRSFADGIDMKESIENETNKLLKEYEVITNRLNLIEKHNLRNALERYRVTKKEPNYFYPVLISMIGFILLILSFQIGFSILIPITTFLLSIFAFTIVAIRKSRVKIHQIRQDELLNEAQLWLTPELKTLDDLEKAIRKLDDEKIRIEILINANRDRLNSFDKTTTLEVVEEQIEEIRRKTGCGDLEQLKAKIVDKRKIESEIDRLALKLSEHLNEKDDTKWQRLVDEKKTAPPSKECDISQKEEIEEQIQRVKSSFNDLKSEVDFFHEFKKKQYNVVDEKDVLKEINELEDRLKNYCLELEAVKRATDILNQMSNELDTFLEDLLAGDNSLSAYFEFVTQRYQKVKIHDQDFVVVDNQGQELPVEVLSSGARDQLLICFRFSALRKIFTDGAFLILDDAFIFADWERRRRLAELLKKTVEEGNQVFYFTSDKHSRDLIAEFGAKIITL